MPDAASLDAPAISAVRDEASADVVESSDDVLRIIAVLSATVFNAASMLLRNEPISASILARRCSCSATEARFFSLSGDEPLDRHAAHTPAPALAALTRSLYRAEKDRHR